MKKADRFERVVIEQSKKDSGLWSDNVVDLLRKEYQWVRRMIRRHAASINGLRADLPPDFVSGYLQASEEFLNMLKQRRK